MGTYIICYSYDVLIFCSRAAISSISEQTFVHDGKYFSDTPFYNCLVPLLCESLLIGKTG